MELCVLKLDFVQLHFVCMCVCVCLLIVLCSFFCFVTFIVIHVISLVESSRGLLGCDAV
jgi:hypothetical protein